MPKPSLMYSTAEIEKLIEEDAIRRGYSGVKVRLETFTPPQQYMMQQGAFGGERSAHVRAIVNADTLKENS